jgi:FAD/FMN-containing dehydrogenase/ferredoxin
MKKIDELKKSLSDIQILDTPADRKIYSQDIGDIPAIMSGTLFKIMPDIIVQPKNVDEIVRVVNAANEKKIPVIVRGAASWGFGGVIPARGGIVIDLSPFRKILKINTKQKTATVEAGARWSDIDILAKKNGLTIMTYPSSKFSTVGGWLSTGGYAINSFKYGRVSQQVVTMTVVTGTGEIKKLTPADREFAYFVSTEGQLGIIVEITIKLRDVPQGSYPYLLYFANDSEAFSFIDRYINTETATKNTPNTIRFLDDNHLADINELMHKSIYEKNPGVLVEFGSEKDAASFKQYLAQNKIAREAPQYTANLLWNERLFGMKSKRLGPTILASEVIIPIKSAVAFIKKAKQLGKYFGVDVFIDTYILENNKALLNATFLCDSRKKKYPINVPFVAILTKAAISLGAAPYGLGLWNSGYILSRYTREKLREIKKYKAQVDPNNILNTGKSLSRGSKGLSGILFNPVVFNTLIQILITTAPVIGRIVIFFLGKNKKVHSLDTELTTYACAKCGNCLAVCPAYLVTKDEKVSPKGKIALMKKLLYNQPVTKEEATMAFLCMHCKACEEMCQTNLELIPLWDTLEQKLEAKYGRPTQQILDFLEKVDASDEYWDMVERNS